MSKIGMGTIDVIAQKCLGEPDYTMRMLVCTYAVCDPMPVSCGAEPDAQNPIDLQSAMPGEFEMAESSRTIVADQVEYRPATPDPGYEQCFIPPTNMGFPPQTLICNYRDEYGSVAQKTFPPVVINTLVTATPESTPDSTSSANITTQTAAAANSDPVGNLFADYIEACVPTSLGLFCLMSMFAILRHFKKKKKGS